MWVTHFPQHQGQPTIILLMDGRLSSMRACKDGRCWRARGVRIDKQTAVMSCGWPRGLGRGICVQKSFGRFVLPWPVFTFKPDW